MAERFIISNYVERQKAIDACVRTQKEVARIISEDGVYHTDNAENIARLLKKFETHVAATPCADVVPKGAYDQVAWERDTAIQQLREDYGVGLGEKKAADMVYVVRCGKCELQRYCETWITTQDPKRFCSEGKPKDGDGDG